MVNLTADDREHLQSLSESELAEFLDSLPTDELEHVIQQLQVAELQDNYASERSRRAAEVQNSKTAAAQECGPLPAVADQSRRERCRTDLRQFCLTYFAATFYLDLAPYQVAMLERFQSVILQGGKECHAVRRGGLKST